jgi:GDP-4-dehydro-6-deoxy-D-mannose reductase
MPGAVLVTGAAGFVGGHLLDMLTSELVTPGTPEKPAAEIVAWHRPGHTPTPRGTSVNWVPVDLLDRASVLEAIAVSRPVVVYHCGGAAHVGHSWNRTEATLSVNVRGTHHLLDALSRAGAAARVLIPSSSLVYRPANEALDEEHELVPANPYGLSKLAQELIGVHSMSPRLSVMVARAFTHIGARQDPNFAASSFARQIADIEAGRQPAEIRVGNLDARRDLTDVRDTVLAYRAIVEGGVPGRPYNVCSGQAMSIDDLLQKLLKRARVPIDVTIDPARLRPSDAPLVLGDHKRIRDELGWAPRISLDHTIDDILEYWRARPA